MTARSARPSAVHVNDAARTAELLVAEARRRGLPWDRMPIAAPAQEWRGLVGRTRRAALGARWLARLAASARSHDIVHVHSASTLPHVRPVVRRFVLHCHGSDVRTRLHQAGSAGAAVRRGLQEAEAVFYSTPDLADHVLPLRPDAELLPVPVDVATLPRWAPDPSRPRVVFASRWEEVKGLQTQLETAGLLVRALGDRAEVVGLRWGPAAQEAAALGVRLLPRLDHAAYLALLAGASAVVGQGAGILSASELEAMGTGAPLAVPTPLPLYADSRPPVLGTSPDSVAEAVVAVLDQPDTHDVEGCRRWVQDWHGPALGVDTLAAAYDAVMAARG